MKEYFIKNKKFSAQDRIGLLSLSLLALFCFATGSIAGISGIRKLPTVTTNWSGFNVGVNGGFSWSNANTQFIPLPAQLPNGDGSIQPSSISINRTGGVLGGQIGYNWALRAYPRVYLGLETDLDWNSLKSSAPGDATGNEVEHLVVFNNVLSTRQKLNWFGTFRGRIGFSPVASCFLYGTGGLAYGSMDLSANTNFIPGGYGDEEYPATQSLTRTGWTAGGGIEWALRQNWSVKFEYLYYDLGSVSKVVNPIIPNPPFQTKYIWTNPVQLVRVGLNYHFLHS